MRPAPTPIVRSNTTVSAERCDEHAEIRARSTPQLDKGVQLRHAKRDGEKNRAERSQRNVSGQRRGQKHHREENQRVDDAGDWCACTSANVCRCARDRAGGGDAARDRAKDIRDSLRDQFLIRIVARIGHAVGDHGGEQRFDRAERGNCESRSHQIAHCFERYCGKMQTR